MNSKQVEELVLQSLEHEQGGVKVYTTALTCAVESRPEEGVARSTWRRRSTHVTALEDGLRGAGHRPRAQETPGRAVVRGTWAGAWSRP